MWQRHRSPTAVVHEWLLPAPERRAARSERRVEDEMRRQRESVHTPERRAAALEAEVRRYDALMPYDRRSGMRRPRP